MKDVPFIPLLLIVLFLLVGCGPPYETDQEKMFGDSPPSFKAYSVSGRTIHYAEVGAGARTLVLFLHGTPGSWQAFAGYLSDQNLGENVNMIAVDRPGFGGSNHGELLPSLSEQASLLHPLLTTYGAGCDIVLVGHSLGAPLAVRMAMDYPELISALVLVAPSLDPELEDPRWYNRLADYQVVSWMVPAELMLANDEVMVLRRELEEMLPLWGKISHPVVLVQGMDDKLVDPGNADFAERMLGDGLKTIRVEDAGHFILWNQPELITSEILELVNNQLLSAHNKSGCEKKG